MSKITNLHEVYVEQLKDIYSAESQLIKALPKMAKAATSPELKQGFEEHLEQTKQHAARLEEILRGARREADRKEVQGHGRPDRGRRRSHRGRCRARREGFHADRRRPARGTL